MNFIQERPRVIKGHLLAKLLIIRPANIGKPVVLQVLPMMATLDYVFRRRTLHSAAVVAPSMTFSIFLRKHG